jgi:hypothetical protein
VFDSEGNALEPLAALADEEEGGYEAGGESLYVAASRPEERFLKAAAAMKL